MIISLIGSVSAQPRAFFVFGDSLVDSGNNDFLATTARADAPPYGIDFPSHRPTGRFSNGLNIPDLISIYIYQFFTTYIFPNKSTTIYIYIFACMMHGLYTYIS